jgi:hypothetical protein
MRLKFNLPYLPRPDQLPTLVEEQGTFAVCYMSGTALVDIPAASEAEARRYQVQLTHRYFPTACGLPAAPAAQAGEASG